MVKKITNIGRAECRFLSEELLTAIQQTVNKHGLTASYDTGRYGGHTATLSFKLDVPALSEKVAGEDAKLLGANFSVGYVFKSNGDEFKVTDFKLRRPKYPVSAQNMSNGKNYKFTVEAINRTNLVNQSREMQKEENNG